MIDDNARSRDIPVALSFPADSTACSVQSPCPVVLLSAGYGVSHTHYQFLTRLFSTLGYLVVSVGHELPGDPPLSVTGNLYDTRSENWQRGSQTLKVVRSAMAQAHPAFDFDQLTLVGHSNGGDISAWLANEAPHFVKQLITLDHRRVPLPRSSDVAVLSVRASDFAADEGVLPTPTEQATFATCIVKIPGSRHNDMSDAGPTSLHVSIQRIVQTWLVKKQCVHVGLEEIDVE